ncbi:MAG: PilZ domain-containing protein [Candidatus Eremiobacteraeota bacterium]|nr:PilZ domain-containing protein [Candidatus Eremiobacteraeota bacterium]
MNGGGTDPQSDALTLGLNAEIAVRLEDLDRQVKLTLVELSEAGARFRANVILPPQAGLSFKWIGHSRDPIVVHGHVADVKMMDKKTAEYGIQLTMPDDMRLRLVNDLLEHRRRKNGKAAPAQVASPTPAPATPQITAAPAAVTDDDDDDPAAAAKRQAYRVVANFPVAVRANKRGRWASLRGEARDISVGGMLLMLAGDVDEGCDLELAFSLPESHETQVEAKEVLEITPFGERRIKKGAATRPYERIHARARVVKRIGNTRSGAPLFGVTFVELPTFLKEEVARFIHEHQLRTLRVAGAHKRHRVSVPRLNGTPAAIRHAVRIHGRVLAHRATPRREISLPQYASVEVPTAARYASKPPAPAQSTYSPDDVFGFAAERNATSLMTPQPNNVVPLRPPLPSDDDPFGLGPRRDLSA